MKSKLLISLSLLTAIFSVEAKSLNGGQLKRLAKISAINKAELYNIGTVVRASFIAAAATGLVCHEYIRNHYFNEPKQLTYFERTQAAVKNAFNGSVNFVQAHKYATAGSVAALVAAGIVAYNYSKKATVKAVETPVVTTPAVPAKVAKRKLRRD